MPITKACAKSDSLIIPPRATLIILNDGLANASILASIKFTVCLFFGKCIVKISDCATTCSSDNISTFSSRARSTEMNGSNAIIRISNASARCATSAPILPRPKMPRVLEASSIPSHLLRSHRPWVSARCACGTLREIAKIKAIVCSAADKIFDSGAFTTITPQAVAAAISTLSRPTPARATTTSSLPAANNCASTFVAERIINALAPTMQLSRSSGLFSSWISTSKPAFRNRSKPGSAISSAITMRGRVMKLPQQ